MVVLASEESKKFIFIKDVFEVCCYSILLSHDSKQTFAPFSLLLQNLAATQNISVNHTEIIPVHYTSGYRETLLQVVEKTKDKTRVYVFIGENVALLALMSLLGDLHEDQKFDLDQNIILAVDNSIDDDMDNDDKAECHQFIAPPWSRILYHIKSGSDWDRLHQLYRSVLRIVPGISDFRLKKYYI